MMGIEDLTVITLQHYLFLGFALFALGALTVIIRKNLIIILMGIELMINGVNLVFISFSHYTQNLEGKILVFFILTIAAAEAGVGLALAVSVYKQFGRVDMKSLESLKG